SVPSQTEATTTPNSVARAPQPGVATAAARASGSGIIGVLAQLAELVVAHEPPREPGRDQHTDAPGRHHAPEHPGGEPQHEPARPAGAVVAEAGAVPHGVNHRGGGDDGDHHGLAPGAADHRVLAGPAHGRGPRWLGGEVEAARTHGPARSSLTLSRPMM